MHDINKLSDLLRKDMVIPVIGAGVSYSTAGLPGWIGLIRDGLMYADRKKLDREGKIQIAKQLLESGELIEAAEIVKELLNAPNHPFSDWLNGLLGKPEIKSTTLLESIQNLCTTIIATTNYDELITSAGAWQTDRACDWSEYEEIQTYLSDGSPFVLHLHGRFRKPMTPIFSANDYRMLENQRGYKSILERLWTSKHFLFIGCSKDGVMDPDFSTVLQFMQEWFPSLPHPHFILMKEDEIEKGTHIDLLKNHNIHAISYGKDYLDLPVFINSINPNIDKLKAIRDQWSDRFGKGMINILAAQTEEAKIATVSKFLKDSLGSPYYWIGNERLKIMEGALRNYNASIANKRDKFEMYQSFIKGLVDISELKENIELWKKYWNEPEKLNNSNFIKLAILAYENLERFPKDILEDIRHRDPYALHPYYLDGGLGRHIHLYQMRKERIGDEVSRLYGDDRYFFENLKRIIASLDEILELSAEKLFAIVQQAKITAVLPKEFFITFSEQQISIRETFNPFKVLAELNIENVAIRDATFVKWNEDDLIIGRTTQFCFRWNPKNELSCVHFFDSPINTAVRDMIVYKEGKILTIEIYCGAKRYTFRDFVLKKEDQLSEKHSHYTRLTSNKKTYCCLTSIQNSIGNCIFEFLGEGKYKPLLTTLDIWRAIKDVPECRKAVEFELKQWDKDSEEQLYMYPFLREIQVDTYMWNNKEVIGILTRLDFLIGYFSLIQIYDSEDNFKLLYSLVLENKPCSYFDLVSNKNEVLLICGFYDHGDIKALVQLFSNIDRNNLVVGSNEPGAIEMQLTPRKIQDIYCINSINSSRVIAIDQNSKMYDIHIPSLQTEEVILEKGIYSIKHFSI